MQMFCVYYTYTMCTLIHKDRAVHGSLVWRHLRTLFVRQQVFQSASHPEAWRTTLIVPPDVWTACENSRSPPPTLCSVVDSPAVGHGSLSSVGLYRNACGLVMKVLVACMRAFVGWSVCLSVCLC